MRPLDAPTLHGLTRGFEALVNGLKHVEKHTRNAQVNFALGHGHL